MRLRRAAVAAGFAVAAVAADKVTAVRDTRMGKVLEIAAHVGEKLARSTWSPPMNNSVIEVPHLV